MTDNDLGVFMHAQNKALNACNADKVSISKIVRPK